MGHPHLHDRHREQVSRNADPSTALRFSGDDKSKWAEMVAGMRGEPFTENSSNLALPFTCTLMRPC